MKQRLIQIAEDCPVDRGIVQKIPVHVIQYEELSKHPYKYDEKNFHEQVNLIRRGKKPGELKLKKYTIRRNPLPKKYGWGIHVNEDGKLALVGCETKKYKELEKDPNVKKTRVSRNKKI